MGADGLGVEGERLVRHEVARVSARSAADEGVAEGDERALAPELMRDDERKSLETRIEAAR